MGDTDPIMFTLTASASIRMGPQVLGKLLRAGLRQAHEVYCALNV